MHEIHCLLRDKMSWFDSHFQKWELGNKEGSGHKFNMKACIERSHEIELGPWEVIIKEKTWTRNEKIWNRNYKQELCIREKDIEGKHLLANGKDLFLTTRRVKQIRCLPEWSVTTSSCKVLTKKRVEGAVREGFTWGHKFLVMIWTMRIS